MMNATTTATSTPGTTKSWRMNSALGGCTGGRELSGRGCGAPLAAGGREAIAHSTAVKKEAWTLVRLLWETRIRLRTVKGMERLQVPAAVWVVPTILMPNNGQRRGCH